MQINSILIAILVMAGVTFHCTGLSHLLFAMQFPLLECPSLLLQLMNSH